MFGAVLGPTFHAPVTAVHDAVAVLAVHDGGLCGQLGGREPVVGTGVVELAEVHGLGGVLLAALGDDGEDAAGGVPETVRVAFGGPVPDGYMRHASSPTSMPRATRPSWSKLSRFDST